MAILKFFRPLIFLLFIDIGMAQDLRITSVDFPSTFRRSTINDMAQDPRGNIWLASINQGLFKYDGTNFVQFAHDRDNHNSLLSDRLECVLIDKEGIIWVGGFDAGLTRFDPINNTFIHFQHSETDSASIRSNSIRSLVQDNEGTIWIGTVEGLDQLDPSTFRFQHHLDQSEDSKVLNEEHIRVLYVDQAGILWAGGSSPFYGEETRGGLFKINVRTKDVKWYSHSAGENSLMDNRVTALYEDSKGNFWVGSAGDGLHIMNRNEGTFKRYNFDPEHPEHLSRPKLRDFSYSADHIRFIQEDDQGSIWIGTMGNGINRYDPKSQKVQYFGFEALGNNKLPTNFFWNSLKTLEGLMWFSSWQPSSNEQILLNINITPIELYQKDLGFPIYSFEEDNDGAMYMGSNNLLIKIDKNGNEDIVFQFDSEVSGSLNHIKTDGKGNLWLSSETGLYKFNISTNSMNFFNNDGINGGSPETWNTEIIDENRILVGTADGLYLFEVDKERFTKIEHSYDEVKSQTQHSVRLIHKDSRNNVWIGLQNYGLKKFDMESQEFIDYPFVESVQNSIRSIYEDDYHNLYVGGSRSGLRRYNRELDDFEVIVDKDGLLTENTGIGAIKALGDSILWVWSISNSGLIKYNLKTNTGFLFDDNWLKPGTGFSAYGIYKSSKDDLYFGTSNGFVKFKSDDFDRKTNYKPSPFVSKFQVNNELVSRSDISGLEDLSLSHTQNNITIVLGYINFLTGSGENILKYRLEEYDNEWRLGKNEEEIIYYKLSPGTYTFRVRAMDVYGEWTENTFSFRIDPPWWLTWWAYLSYAIFFVLGIWRIHLFQKGRLLKLEREKSRERELAQAKEIEKAYAELKATQAQLIHSEKMASLGELTAGIAHEIQNPLNFVNNFSEVSSEMVDEMRDEIKSGDFDEAEAISLDLKQNLEKIHHHGKRAESIVKGMLMHSRTSKGEKVPTDINALCDEFLRLSYHGLRAKDRTFNAEFNTDFDETLPKINLIPQDLGRVMLNLFNNAFQACAEKPLQGLRALEGVVKVSTKNLGDKIAITVSDNGPGIPDDIKDKIFQPFFTTKPTGQGTGLGLSLAYDIVKAHGGALNVRSEMGNGTEFVISLPIA